MQVIKYRDTQSPDSTCGDVKSHILPFWPIFFF